MLQNYSIILINYSQLYQTKQLQRKNQHLYIHYVSYPTLTAKYNNFLLSNEPYNSSKVPHKSIEREPKYLITHHCSDLVPMLYGHKHIYTEHTISDTAGGEINDVHHVTTRALALHHSSAVHVFHLYIVLCLGQQCPSRFYSYIS